MKYLSFKNTEIEFEYADLVLEIPEGAITETGIIEAKAKQIDDALESVNEQIGMIISLNLLNPETKFKSNR